jgi:hypothetical protein
MRRFLNKLAIGFRSTSTARSARRTPRRASPQIESLERREVLSASSPSIHAVIGGTTSMPNLYYIDKSDHGLYGAAAIDSAGDLTTNLLNGGGKGPQAVQALSAGHGAYGAADVVAEAGDGSLWEDNISWKELLGPGQVKSFAAVDGGRVFAIFSDSTLHLYNGSGWSLVPTPGTVQALDAITDKFGHDTVYVLNGDNTFGEVTYLPTLPLPGARSAAVARATTVNTGPGGAAVGSQMQPHYTQLAAAGHIVFHGQVVGSFAEVVKFSAGTDANGYADVFATWWTGGLYENVGNTAAGWSLFAAAGSFTDYNAIDRGQVWINNGSSLTLYTAPGTVAEVNLAGNLTPVTISGTWTAFSGVGASSNFACTMFAVGPSGELSWIVYDPNLSFPVHASGGPNGYGIYPYLG